MATKQRLTLGSQRGIGSVSIDEGALRGEGGAARPRLVVPLDVSLDATQEGAQLAVVALDAMISVQEPPQAHNAIGRIIAPNLINSFPLLSQTYEHTTRIELRFELNQAEIELLERRRHEERGDKFLLHLRLVPTVVALEHFNSTNPRTAAVERSHERFEIQFGLMSRPTIFWTAAIDDARLQIEHAAWIRDVLPGLGYDRARIVELTFPPAFPDHQSAITQFDAARTALAQRRYDDCVAGCRGLLNVWETHLGATRSRTVAAVVAERWGWDEADPRRRFLDGLWKTLGDVTNAPHHPESRRPGYLDLSEARLALYLTSLLSEYLMEQQA